jgi:phage-related minor tail protein
MGGLVGKGLDWLKGVFSSDGNAFSSGNVVQMFANGGAFGNGSVLTKPTMFALGGTFGVAGEAGPEGALPLKRMSNGKLGVYMEGNGGGMTIHQNITVGANADKAEVRRSAASGARMALGAMNGARRYG